MSFLLSPLISIGTFLPNREKVSMRFVTESLLQIVLVITGGLDLILGLDPIHDVLVAQT